jgi:hypothetical protein
MSCSLTLILHNSHELHLCAFPAPDDDDVTASREARPTSMREA